MLRHALLIHRRWLPAFVLSFVCVLAPSQQPRPAAPAAPTPAAPSPAAPSPAVPSPGVTNPPAPAPGVATPAAPSADPQGSQGAQNGKPDDKPKPPPKRGIPIDDPLVHTHCSKCHQLDARQLMTRISYLRKSPEGWSESLKRMIRLHGLQISPGDAKAIVRSLSNSNGLARSEAERGLYESERRVHWSEEQRDEDFRRACSECHPLGRVLLQQRDEEEWQLLRATHVAMFPLSRGQIGGGPPEDEMRRFGGPVGGSPAGGSGSASNPGGGARGRGNDGPPQPQQSVGDRVLSRLQKEQPLFTPAWERWAKNRREVPLAGRWVLTGHETGLGDLTGEVEIRRTDADEYDTTWTMHWSNGTSATRTGKGILYAGYSWRGRSSDPSLGDKAPGFREVLLLDDAWQVLRGRLFTGNYDELGADVALHRELGRPRVLALGQAAVVAPCDDHELIVHGESFPEQVAPTDLFVGAGVTVKSVERRSAHELRVHLAVAPRTELGPRTVAFGNEPGSAVLQLYDTVDYVRISPLQGLARVGGAKHPKQLERFEAIAVYRGPDGKPYTEDDVDLFQVQPRWSLEEFRVREDDDDLAFVGAIDPATGVFTPNVDGPNPARKWSANNVGDVFVTAVVDLEVGVRPPPPPTPKPEPGKPTPPPAVLAPPEAPKAPLPREQRTFRSRGHLIVTVPLFARWNSLEWEER